MHKYIINFTNGQYNLKNKTFTPSNNIHPVNVGYDYIPYQQGSDIDKEIDQYLQQMFPDINNRNEFLNAFAKALAGNDSKQNILELYGTGNNGKTRVMQLIQTTFGQYCSNAIDEDSLENLKIALVDENIKRALLKTIAGDYHVVPVFTTNILYNTYGNAGLEKRIKVIHCTQTFNEVVDFDFHRWKYTFMSRLIDIYHQ